jgi:hypothetical protein
MKVGVLNNLNSVRSTPILTFPRRGGRNKSNRSIKKL